MTDGSAWIIAGRYRVLGRIGTGGMADVLRAHDDLLDRDVAVKVFRSVVSAPDGTQDTAKGVERQRAELAALARLNHPNLTMLYDGSIVGQQGPAYLVMELIEGPSLSQAIADGTLSEAQIRTVGAQIGDALAYVHAAGMVHRDVKPANILVGNAPGVPTAGPTGEGLRARLTDFGIVRLVGTEPLTRADMTLGSASYLAPEQARGSAVGPPADVYALGLTLLEALTGRRSFDGPALEAVVARLSNDPEIPAGLPQPWPGLLRAVTDRDPARRPTAARVAAVLRGAESVTAPVSAVPAGTYDTAVLPAAVPLPVGGTMRLPADATSGPPAGPTGSRGAVPAGRPRRRWSASLIVAGLLVLALVVAGVALLLANSGGSGSPQPGDSGRTTPARHRSTSASGAPSRHHPHSSSPATSSRPSTTPSTRPRTSTTPTTTTPTTPGKSSTPSSANTTPSTSPTPTKAGRSSPSS